ncbi:hypothetical protein GmHk_02G003518 [Glycine max]|nr:hypothetical protein GmHk_02G003518 [Glycine max]
MHYAQPVDEIKEYYDCRYVSACEGAWRIFEFDLHYKWLPVQRLIFHLPNQQAVYFNDYEEIESFVERHEQVQTMFLAWFEANKNFVVGRDLTYSEFPTKFVYCQKEKMWQPRKKGQSIGTLQYIPPGIGELYYMRILLTMQRGCTGYDCLKTVSGEKYNTFQEACYELGFLANDREFIDAINEGSELATDLQISESELKNLCLIEFENLLKSNGRSLIDYPSMTLPVMSDIVDFQKKLIVDEMSYDRDEMTKNHFSLMKMLTTEQKGIYQEIMSSVMSESGTTNNNEDGDDIREFVDWILMIRDGNRDEDDEGEIDIPKNLLNPLLSLVDFACPNLLQNINQSKYFQERAIKTENKMQS